MIPEGWSIAQLGPLTRKIGSGLTPLGGQKAYLDQGIPLIRSQNVLNGKLVLDDVAYISDEQHQKMNNSMVRPNDVLLNITGASIGRCCTVPEDFTEGNVNQHVCIIRPSEKLDAVYLMSVLISSLGQKQIWQFQAGGNRQGLNFDQIRSFRFLLPPLPEQRAIAAILGTWDRAIILTERRLAAAEQRKKALMQKVLTGRVRFPEFVNHPAYDWQGLEFGEFVVKSSKKFDPRRESKVWPCVELEHISQGTGVILGTISTAEQKSVKNYFKPGQVLFGKLRPYLRKYAQPDFEGVCSSEIWVLSGKKHICENAFLFYLVQSDHFINAANVTSGTKMPRAEWNHVLEFAFGLPTLPEQRRIAAVLDACDREIDLLRRKRDAIQQQKKGLMQRLLTGQVRVKEAMQGLREEAQG